MKPITKKEEHMLLYWTAIEKETKDWKILIDPFSIYVEQVDEHPPT